MVLGKATTNCLTFSLLTNYRVGNDCAGITIRSNGIIDKAKEENYPIEQENDVYKLTSPDGYKFYIIDEAPKQESKTGSPFFLNLIETYNFVLSIFLDLVEKVTINCTNLTESLEYWHNILDMTIVSKDESKATLSYGDDQANLELNQIGKCPFLIKFYFAFSEK